MVLLLQPNTSIIQHKLPSSTTALPFCCRDIQGSSATIPKLYCAQCLSSSSSLSTSSSSSSLSSYVHENNTFVNDKDYLSYKSTESMVYSNSSSSNSLDDIAQLKSMDSLLVSNKGIITETEKILLATTFATPAKAISGGGEAPILDNRLISMSGSFSTEQNMTENQTFIISKTSNMNLIDEVTLLDQVDDALCMSARQASTTESNTTTLMEKPLRSVLRTSSRSRTLKLGKSRRRVRGLWSGGSNMFSDLHDDVIFRILSHFSMEELLKASMICHRFNYVCKLEDAWKTVDATGFVARTYRTFAVQCPDTASELSTRTLNNHLQKHNPDSLTIKVIDHQLKADLFQPPMKYLKELHLSGFADLSDTHVHVLLLSLAVGETLTPVRVSTNKGCALTSLRLDHCPRLTDRSVQYISINCPHLLKFSLLGNHQVSSITSLKNNFKVKLPRQRQLVQNPHVIERTLMSTHAIPITASFPSIFGNSSSASLSSGLVDLFKTDSLSRSPTSASKSIQPVSLPALSRFSTANMSHCTATANAKFPAVSRLKSSDISIQSFSHTPSSLTSLFASHVEHDIVSLPTRNLSIPAKSGLLTLFSPHQPSSSFGSGIAFPQSAQIDISPSLAHPQNIPLSPVVLGADKGFRSIDSNISRPSTPPTAALTDLFAMPGSSPRRQTLHVAPNSQKLRHHHPIAKLLNLDISGTRVTPMNLIVSLQSACCNSGMVQLDSLRMCGSGDQWRDEDFKSLHKCLQIHKELDLGCINAQKGAVQCNQLAGHYDLLLATCNVDSIQRLCLAGHANLTATTVCQFLDKCSKLTDLQLEGCCLYCDNDDIIAFSDSLSRFGDGTNGSSGGLQKLSLARWFSVAAGLVKPQEQTMRYLFESLINSRSARTLLEIDLRGWWWLTGNDIERLYAKCPRVSTLYT